MCSELKSHKLKLGAFQFFHTETSAKDSNGRFTRNKFAKKYSSAFFSPSNFYSTLKQMGCEKRWEL